MAAYSHHFASGKEVSIETFEQICDRKTDIKDYPLAAAIENNIVIYDGSTLRAATGGARREQDIKNELHYCLKDGPGVFAVTGFFDDLSAVDASTRIFEQIIADEKAARGSRGDHFAPADSNARIWNSLQKVCYADPEVFVDYYSNPLFALVNEAWLGPGYQLTAQVNVVRPGGQAQMAHRDYHFGFQSEELTARFPVILQVASQYLTLQGAIAHTDMPLESGPTLLLPYSQRYELGYLAYRYDEFRRYFDASAVQLPLRMGTSAVGPTISSGTTSATSWIWAYFCSATRPSAACRALRGSATRWLASPWSARCWWRPRPISRCWCTARVTPPTAFTTS